ncbi:MAG: CocE/NonD family hydrolase, partial [Jatrophihabitantaceae bacterium]
MTIVESSYLTVRDGTELAAYVFRPSVAKPVPVVWLHDRYHQVCPPPPSAEHADVVGSLIGAEPFDLGLEPAEPGPSLRAFAWAPRLLREGIAVAVVDSRGSGASGGISDGPFSPAETTDCYDVTEWLAAQDWCSGRVGMAGRSYLGISQFLAASAAPPHLVAVFPQMALFDLHNFCYDGGIFRDDFAAAWGAIVERRDCLDPAVAVATDPDTVRLARYRDRHRANTPVAELFARNRRRTDADSVIGEQLFLSRSPSERVATINASGVAVYNLGGWHDVWARDTLEWEQQLQVPHRTVLGPWSHTGGIVGSDRYNLIEEHARWFGHWLKGDPQTGTDSRVRYFAMGSAERGGWRQADQWPPPGLVTLPIYLDTHGSLSTTAPAVPGRQIGAHPVDWAASSGPHSRWASGYGAPFDYSGIAANDEHCAVYVSQPLSTSVELTGATELQLALAPLAVPTDVFGYLQCVGADGTVRYVTEGCVRVAAGSTEAALVMQPICWVFDAGDRIKLALAGCDRDNAETPVLQPPPELPLLSGCALRLPVAAIRTEPASLAQQSIWLAEQLGGQGSSYHLPAVLEFTGPVEAEALWQAVDEIVRRHEPLRTTLRADDGAPTQQVHPWVPLPRVHLTADGDSFDARIAEFVAQPFDLTSDWPLRVALVSEPAGRTALVVVVHHIAGDQQAASTFFAELSAGYASGLAGAPHSLPQLTTDYAGYAARQRQYLAGAAGQGDLAYWREELTGAPQSLRLPLDRPRSESVESDGDRLTRVIDPGLTASVRSGAAAARASNYEVLLTAFAIAVSAFCDTDDLVLAVPNMDRGEADEQALIGCFVNVLPVRVRLDPQRSLAETLGSTRRTLRAGLRHRRVPFDAIVAACAGERSAGVQPLTQVSLRVTPQLPAELPFGPVTARPWPATSYQVKYDLAASVVESGPELAVHWEYRTAILDADTVAAIAETFETVLRLLVEEPDRSVLDSRRAPVVDLVAIDPAGLPPGLEIEPHAKAWIADADGSEVRTGGWGRLWWSGVEGTPQHSEVTARIAGGRLRFAPAP